MAEEKQVILKINDQGDLVDDIGQLIWSSFSSANFQYRVFENLLHSQDLVKRMIDEGFSADDLVKLRAVKLI